MCIKIRTIILVTQQLNLLRLRQIHSTDSIHTWKEFFNVLRRLIQLTNTNDQMEKKIYKNLNILYFIVHNSVKDLLNKSKFIKSRKEKNVVNFSSNSTSSHFQNSFFFLSSHNYMKYGSLALSCVYNFLFFTIWKKNLNYLQLLSKYNDLKQEAVRHFQVPQHIFVVLTMFIWFFSLSNLHM